MLHVKHGCGNDHCVKISHFFLGETFIPVHVQKTEKKRYQPKSSHPTLEDELLSLDDGSKILFGKNPTLPTKFCFPRPFLKHHS